MHNNALLRLTVTVGLVGLGAFMGCSSTSTTTSGGTTTDTGTTTATGTATGTTTGTTTGTGTGGQGQGGNGQGGNAGGSGQGGGAPNCSGVYESGIPECNTCLEGGCCQEIVDCTNDPNCAPCLAGTDGCTQSGDPFDNLVACIGNSCDVECTPPAPPSCNPVTGEPCDLAKGEACDLGSDGNGGSSFQCFPAPNDAALCAACDNTAGPFCQGGLHCDTNTCAKYCCSDADCGAGNVCDVVFAPDCAAGLCHDAVGGAAACSAPKPSPSGGACMP